MTKNSFIFGALSLLALGCQDNQIVINAEREPILGGASASAGQFPSVVSILSGQGVNVGLCTGTLISPTTVLTAAHCIDPQLSGLANAQQVAANTTVRFSSTSAFGGGFTRGASQTIQHPNHPDFSNPNTLGQHDIGVIILASPVNNIAPSPVEFNAGLNLVGAAVTQVGYGLTNPNNQNSAGNLFFVSNNADNCSSFGFNNASLVCLNQQDGKGSCEGDSGGPLFGAAGEVLGVTSFGDQNCGLFGAYTRTSFEADFAAQFVDGGTPPDCSANNQCNPVCVSTPDPDCENCEGDGVCTAGCGANGNPADPDCGSGECGAGDGCNQQCAFVNQIDPDCANEEDGNGCAITPTQQGSTPAVPVVMLFALFGLGLLISRRR